MIDLGMDAYPKPAAPGEKVEFENGYYYYDDKDNNNLHIVRYGIGAVGNELAGRNTQDYYIKSYWSQMYTNNTIVCKIIKNKITYTALHEMTFGTAGTTGADCTLVLDFEKNRTAILPGKTVKVRARLYDYENKEITTFQNDQYVRWSWRNEKSLQPTMTIENKEKFSCEISFNGTIGYCYNILEATLENWGRGDIVAYLPIPIATKEDAYISGTTTVIYSSSGEALSYFQNPYVYYDKDGRKDGVTWKIRNRTISADSPYVPQLINDRLAPLSFYVKGACEDNCVVAEQNGEIIWSQPLLIEQNKYASTTLGNWDGELNVGEQEKGTILAPRIAAGKKNIDNTFSGVILGDWKDDAGLQLTGMYGFNKGEQSFAFKEDGTAFLGKNGHGRIEFDGNKGLIQSQQYNKNKKGMMIDLDDGIIEMSKGKDDHHIKIDSTAAGGVIKDDTPKEAREKCPFVIGDNFYVDWDGSAWMTNGTFSGTLASADGHFTGSIKVGQYFEVTEEGKMTATDGIFSGVLKAATGDFTGKITAKDGEIGGWKIGPNSISAGNLVLKSDGTILGSNLGGQLSSFEVGTNGITINNAIFDAPDITEGRITGRNITLADGNGDNYFIVSSEGGTPSVAIGGTIAAKAGKIGLWDITEKGELTNGTIVLAGGAITAGSHFSINGDGSMKTGEKFTVSADGVMKATGAEIEGKITAEDGEIGGWKISETTLIGGNLTLNSEGSISTTNFSLSKEGKLKADDVELTGTIIAKKGEIGGWTINESGTLTGGGITLASGSITVGEAIVLSGDGSFKAGKFNVDSSGNIKATGAQLTSCEVTNTLKFGDAACSLKKLTVTQSIGVGTQTVGLSISGDQKIKIPALTFDEKNTSVNVNVHVTGSITMPGAHLTGHTVQIKDKDGNLLGSVWEPDTDVEFSESTVSFTADGKGTGTCSGQTATKDDVNITLNVTGNDIDFDVPVILKEPVTTEIYYLAASDESISFTADGGGGSSGGGIIENPPRKDFTMVQM